MATTLLQMVNRVRREGRHPVVSVIDTAGDELTAVLVEMVNTAKRDVLEAEDWNFDIRHDGTLKVAKRREYTGVSVTEGNSTIVNAGATDFAEYGNGEAVAKIVVTGAATYSDVSFRITDAYSFAGSDAYIVDVAWPGATESGLTGEVYADEYVLPGTVKDILSVRDEDGDVRLDFVEKNNSFDSIVPAPHRTGSSSPDVVYVGATLTATTTTGVDATSGLGMMIHPIPDDDYILRYSYRYRHPDLALATDTLDNVPERVVDDIVGIAKELAFSNHVFNDPRLAKFHEERNERSRRRSKWMDDPQPNRRVRFGSHTRTVTNSGSRVANRRIFYEP